MKNLLLATTFAVAAFAAPTHAQTPITQNFAVPTHAQTPITQNCSDYAAHAAYFGNPEVQRRARELAEALKDEKPVLIATMKSLPGSADVAFDQFVMKIKMTLLQKTSDLMGAALGTNLLGPMGSKEIASCFPDLYPVMENFKQRAKSTETFHIQKAQEADQRRKEENDKRFATLIAAGYKLVTLEDFVLDGRELAASNTKVVLEGYYAREGNFDVFYRAPSRAMAMTK